MHSPLATSFTSYGPPHELKRNPRNTDVDMFIVHHAASPSLSIVKGIFASPGGRGTSANYIVCDDQIISSVPDEYRAWTGGGKRDGAIYDGSTLDRRAITVETINSGVAKDGWPISDKSFESLARLIEERSRFFGFPLDRNHVIGHGEMLTRFRAGFATACPGGISVDALVERAKQIRKGNTTPKPPVKSPEQLYEEELMGAREDIAKDVAKIVEDSQKKVIDQVTDILSSRTRREVRPGIYFVEKDAQGNTYTVDNSPFAALIHPSGGMILPLNPPVEGKRGQVESLKSRYRIPAFDERPSGFTEEVYFNTLKDIARGHGRLPIDISEADGQAWGREIHRAVDASVGR